MINTRSTLKFARLTCWALLILGASGVGNAVPWFPFGPDGGDARSLTADPKDPAHLYLGTANGWVYESRTGGERWARLARVAKRDDLVIDNIVVDTAHPQHLLVGAWVLDHPDGGLFISTNGGATWLSQPEMRGQSVRALAEAPSDPQVMVAGTLNGVYRSSDGGEHWKLISPEGSNEIHEIESIAIDPKDPQTIYAGTWHLPWKTIDGGEHWENIKQGVIEDSDVFSIIVDPETPKTVYASACSGIYKSEDGGGRFTKVQGIPSTARRTRVLMQDPVNRARVFAGTTEGLFRTEDAGKSWMRMTGGDVIVNDVYVDPSAPSHVLLATDRGGVLASDDGGTTFRTSNQGFSARQVRTSLADPEHPARLYVGVVNDKESGGVFLSEDGGLSWSQESSGLEGRDVFSLGRARNGTVLAGTGHGIFRLQAGQWSRVSDAAAFSPVALVSSSSQRTVSGRPVGTSKAARGAGARSAAKGSSANVAAKSRAAHAAHHVPGVRTHSSAKRGTAVAGAKLPTVRKAQLKRARVVPGGLARRGASASKPLAMRTTATGASKVSTATASKAFDGSVLAMASSSDAIFAATSQGVLRSEDDGSSWKAVSELGTDEWPYLAAAGPQIAIANLKTMMLSKDAGKTWSAAGLPDKLSLISAIAVDDQGELWVGGREGIFLSTDSGSTWQTLKGLFLTDVNSIFYDSPSQKIMVTTHGTTTIAFVVSLPAKSVSYWDTGWNLRFVRPVGDHLVGATLFDGMVVQPRMVDSVEKAQR